MFDRVLHTSLTSFHTLMGIYLFDPEIPAFLSYRLFLNSYSFNDRKVSINANALWIFKDKKHDGVDEMKNLYCYHES